VDVGHGWTACKCIIVHTTLESFDYQEIIYVELSEPRKIKIFCHIVESSGLSDCCLLDCPTVVNYY